MAHNHGKKGPKLPKNVIFFTMAHITAGFVLMYYITLQNPREQPELFPRHYFVFHMGLFTFFYLLCMTNLILCKIRGPGRAYKSPNEVDERCDRCNFERVPRTHHCSTCKMCVIRMDHHCAWVSSCIGLNNHKHFIWFTFYLAVGGSHYTYHVFRYYFSDSPTAYENFFIKLAFFYVSTMIFLFVYFVFTLIYSQIRFIIKNNTTIDYMKEMGSTMAFLRFVIWDMESHYDRGLLPNVINVMGFDFFNWFLPTAPQVYYFTQGPCCLPKPDLAEIKEFKVKYDLDD